MIQNKSCTCTFEKRNIWFNGKTTKINCGKIENSDSFTKEITVEAWIKRPNVTENMEESNSGHIVNQGGGWKDDGWSLFCYESRLRIEVVNEGKHCLLDSQEYLPRGEWTYVAFTWNGKQTSMYINGKQVNKTTKDVPSTLKKNSTLGQNICIGCNEKRNYYFQGLIKQVRLWDKELSENELFKNYETIFKYFIKIFLPKNCFYY